jgi:hypothetical protein
MEFEHMRVVASALLISAIASQGQPIKASAPCIAVRPKAALQARVVDATTSAPLPLATINTELWGGTTDSAGMACVRDLEPVRHRTVAWRLGYAPETLELRFDSGLVTVAEFRLHRLPPPCCRLAGAWHVEMTVIDAGSKGHTHVGVTTAGRIVFGVRFPNPMPERYALEDSLVRFEFGRHIIDLAPLFGGPYGQDVSTTVFGGGPSLFYEVVGLVESRDSLSMTIIPRMSHGGLSLWGRIVGDTIAGRWEENAYCCGATGSFLMHRLAWTAGDDSLAAVAVADSAVEAQATLAAAEAFQRRSGRLRVRTYDLAISRFVAASYWIIREGDPPSEELSTMIESDSTGWSEYGSEEPGTYRVELSDYPCGDKRYFADSSYVRSALLRKVTVRTGADAEVDFRIDSRAIVAARSYDNRGGVRCAYRPAPQH